MTVSYTHAGQARSILEEATELRDTPRPPYPATEAYRGDAQAATRWGEAVDGWERDQQRARDLVAAAQVHATLAAGGAL